MPRRVPSRNPPSGGDDSPSGPYRALKQAGLVLLFAAWALLGVVGHDPWKTEDATAFGVAWDMMQSGNLLVPTLAGEPYLRNPPLIHALAALSGRLFSGSLAVHDAARLTASFLLGLTLVALTGAGLELNGRRTRWLPALLFVGCLGLWDRAHQLSPELGLLLGVAGALYGLALALRRPVAGGAVTGLAAAFGFLSHGPTALLWIGITLIALPIAFAHYRTRNYARTATAAIVIGALTAATWPLALRFVAPDHLAAWWAQQMPAGFWSRIGSDPLAMAKNLPWFTWPALPLVLWTLWTRGRGFNGGLLAPGVEIPGVLALVVIVCLTLTPEPRAILAVPLLVPLALLAALEIDTLKRGFSAALDWFGILTFGLLAALVWGIWIDAWFHGMSPAVAHLFRDTEIGYRPPLQWGALAVSLFLSALWLALVRPARRSNRRAVLNWAAGVTLIWGLYTTIWLPYLDSRRSYRSVAESLATQIPTTGCVASRNLGEPQRALFRYFAALSTVREEVSPVHDCETRLVQYGRIDRPPETPDGWYVAWDGRRRGDDTELFVLYRKVAR
jgi:4-amino-4-deoxy-L-arabinose transferase-like glycosyltransferase